MTFIVYCLHMAGMGVFIIEAEDKDPACELEEVFSLRVLGKNVY